MSKPIRVLHHWACSGGTLFSKCIAALSDVILLSEIHPYAYLRGPIPQSTYNPTDIIQQLCLEQNRRDPRLCLAAFNGAIDRLHEECSRQGLALVLRSHSHLDFFIGGTPANAPLVSYELKKRHQLCELVTVRHPLDSWLSLKINEWDKHFRFSSFDEYCARCQAMLYSLQQTPLLRYEEFCSDPERVFTEVCRILNLKYDDSALTRSRSITLSGSSGRVGSEISKRERRVIPDDVLDEIRTSLSYVELCALMAYDPDPRASFPFTQGEATPRISNSSDSHDDDQ